MTGYECENLKIISGISHSFCTADVAEKPHDLFYCAQQHGAGVIQVGAGQQAGAIAADAVFTGTTRPIAIVTADCLPILVGSSHDQFVAAIHGGWKGLVDGVIENSFNAFRKSGISLQYLHVGIGPAIQACCYEVDVPLIGKIESVHGHLWRGRPAPWSVAQRAASKTSLGVSAAATHANTWLDLPLYCKYLLEAAGVESEQVNVLDTCTYCSGLGFASYRRRTHFNESKAFQYSWIRLMAP